MWSKVISQLTIVYTNHARRRMRWRKISETEVEQTLENPDKSELTGEDRKNFFKTIGNKYIKVTYRETKDEIIIISIVNKSD
ncbi:MAG: DUF4258 domain-containing protein [Bacteroidia bacterium]|nr:DUF4258 domain-containing protein [Bacteroidia bacterium]